MSVEKNLSTYFISIPEKKYFVKYFLQKNKK